MTTETQTQSVSFSTRYGGAAQRDETVQAAAAAIGAERVGSWYLAPAGADVKALRAAIKDFRLREQARVDDRNNAHKAKRQTRRHTTADDDSGCGGGGMGL